MFSLKEGGTWLLQPSWFSPRLVCGMRIMILFLGNLGDQERDNGSKVIQRMDNGFIFLPWENLTP